VTDNIHPHIAANYEQFVADGTRTYEQIAEEAEKDGSPALAAWARSRTEQSDGTDGGSPDNGEKPLEEHTLAELKTIAQEFPSIEPKSSWVKAAYVDAIDKARTEQAEGARREAEGEYANLSDDDLRDLAGMHDLDVEGDRASLIERLQAADAAE